MLRYHSQYTALQQCFPGFNFLSFRRLTGMISFFMNKLLYYKFIEKKCIPIILFSYIECVLIYWVSVYHFISCPPMNSPMCSAAQSSYEIGEFSSVDPLLILFSYIPQGFPRSHSHAFTRLHDLDLVLACCHGNHHSSQWLPLAVATLATVPWLPSYEVSNRSRTSPRFKTSPKVNTSSTWLYSRLWRNEP